MVAFMNAADIDQQRNELVDEMSAITEQAKAENRDLTDDENARIDEIQGSDGQGGELAKLDADYKRKSAIEQRAMAKAKERVASGELQVPNASDHVEPFANIRVPSNVFRAKSETAFRGPDGARDGYVSGLWIAATLANHAWAKDKLESLGIKNAMSEGTDSAGGFAVPDPLANEIIRQVEEFGVARRYLRVVPMTSDTLKVPRLTAGATVYNPAEGASITAADLTLAQATLTATKYACRTLMSTELAEDAVISMAALIAQEFGYAIAVQEDTNAFLGDGTGTYFSVTGFENALAAGSVKTAASGQDTVQELTLASYHAAKGAQLKVPGRQNAWFVNSDVYENSMAPLMTAAGGNTATDIANGTAERFLGQPVVFTEVLPDSSAAASSTVAYYGDLRLAGTLGNRRDVNIKTLMELYAETDQIGLIATSRAAITIHEVGTASIGGPVTAVKLAAS